MHLSSTVLGITMLSFCTTLPEKFLAVLGASCGHGGIVVASTPGSNIFLLALCLRIVGLSSDQVHSSKFLIPFELAMMWVSSAIFCLIIFLGAGRLTGILLIILYVAFLVLEVT